MRDCIVVHTNFEKTDRKQTAYAACPGTPTTRRCQPGSHRPMAGPPLGRVEKQTSQRSPGSRQVLPKLKKSAKIAQNQKSGEGWIGIHFLDLYRVCFFPSIPMPRRWPHVLISGRCIEICIIFHGFGAWIGNDRRTRFLMSREKTDTL